MSQLTKAQLATENSTSFPNNTTGYITPELLRNYNTDMIDSTVNQTIYDADSASFDSRVDSLEQFSSSLTIDYINQTELNAATASLSASLTTTINTKVSSTTFNSFSSSVTQSLEYLSQSKASLIADNSFTGSQSIGGNITASGNIAGTNITASNNIKAVGGISGSGLGIQGSSVIGGNASDVQTLKGTVYIPNNLVLQGVSWSIYSASIFTSSVFNNNVFASFSQSTAYRINALEVWSSSLDTGYVTEAEFSAYSASAAGTVSALSSSVSTGIANSISAYSASQYAVNNSFINTGSLVATQYISGTLILTGSARLQLTTASFFNDGSGNKILGYQYVPSASAFSYLEANTNLPQYMNQAVKIGAINSGSTVGGFVKVMVNPSLIAVGGTTEINSTGILQVSQSSTDLRQYFAYNGNPQSDGEKTLLVQRGLHKVAGNGLGFPLAQAASYPVGAPIYWNGAAEGAMTITRPTNGKVLRLGYIASIQDDPTAPYVRQMWYDPFWEEGETIINPIISGSITGSGGGLFFNGALYVSSAATYDIDVTGSIQANSQMRVSSSIGAVTILGNQLSVSSGSYQTILSRLQIANTSGSTAFGFLAGAANTGFNMLAPGPSLFANSGSTTTTASIYYPVQFQQATAYTDGRVTFTKPLVVSSSVYLSGSVSAQVGAVPVASSTASIDCSKGNFFTLSIPAGATTYVTATNTQAGQTVTVKLAQGATTGSLVWNSNFKFTSGSINTGTPVANATDILTFVTFDTTTLWCSIAKNLV